MTKKERVNDLVSSLEGLGVRNISTNSNPQINAEEVFIPFGAIPGSNTNDLQYNYTITDDGFVVFLGPLYKCDKEHYLNALLVVNRLNQENTSKFYVDDYGNVCMKEMEMYIDNGMQLAGKFVQHFQNYINEEFMTSLRNRIEK